MMYLSKFEDENNWKKIDECKTIKSYSDFILEDKTEDIEINSDESDIEVE